MRSRIKTVATRRQGWCEDGYERGEFFNWANSLFVVDWSSQWEDHFCLMREHIKVLMSDEL